jgi:hypothetical protein
VPGCPLRTPQELLASASGEWMLNVPEMAEVLRIGRSVRVSCRELER